MPFRRVDRPAFEPAPVDLAPDSVVLTVEPGARSREGSDRGSPWAVTGHDLLLFATGLFAIQSPPTTVGAFLSYTKGLPLPIQRQVALRSALAMALAMIIVVFVGERLLSLLGVTVPMLQSAGGLILLVTGMQMVSGQGLPGAAADTDPETHWRTMAVVPIAIPLNVGGGAIAFIVAVSSTNPATPDQLALSAICVGMAVLTGVVYVFAAPVARRLGVTGMEVLTRLFGIVLVAIAFGVLATGLRGLFPGLAA